MMIPKNRDNSGTGLLYIVGLDSVRPGFRRANVANEPRAVAVRRRVGSIRVLAGIVIRNHLRYTDSSGDQGISA